jgi:hypothetical protein
MASANCGSNARRGKTAANTSTTGGRVTTGAFCYTAGSGAPHRSARGSPRSYADASRSNPGRHQRPSPTGASRLHSTLRWATASRSYGPGLPSSGPWGHDTGSAAMPASRRAAATPTRRQHLARRPARRPTTRTPAHAAPLGPWLPSCSADVQKVVPGGLLVSQEHGLSRACGNFQSGALTKRPLAFRHLRW